MLVPMAGRVTESWATVSRRPRVTLQLGTRQAHSCSPKDGLASEPAWGWEPCFLLG